MTSGYWKISLLKQSNLVDFRNLTQVGALGGCDCIAPVGAEEILRLNGRGRGTEGMLRAVGAFLVL